MTELAKEVKLNRSDQLILKSMEPIVDGIATAYGPNCEVVLHSLEDISHSCIKIRNSHVTGRKLGSALKDFTATLLFEDRILESDSENCYFSKTTDGRWLKSTTILIKNPKNKIIGLLCINMDLSTPMVEFLKPLTPPEDRASARKKTRSVSQSVHELVITTLRTVMISVNNQRGLSALEKNLLITREMYSRGMFNIKGAVDIIAKEMKVSRSTIYGYIREAKWTAPQ